MQKWYFLWKFLEKCGKCQSSKTIEMPLAGELELSEAFRELAAAVMAEARRHAHKPLVSGHLARGERYTMSEGWE